MTSAAPHVGKAHRVQCNGDEMVTAVWPKRKVLCSGSLLSCWRTRAGHPQLAPIVVLLNKKTPSELLLATERVVMPCHVGVNHR